MIAAMQSPGAAEIEIERNCRCLISAW